MGRHPRYRQLADELAGQIRSGELALGARFPTEAELCERHGLSRGTVRQALRCLEDAGMIARRPGAGGAVVSPAPVFAYHPLMSGADDIAAMVAQTHVVRPDTGEITADEETAARLGIPAGTRWWWLSGVRERRDRRGLPLCWSENYLRADLSHRREVMTASSVDPAHHGATSFEQEITAVVLDPARARALRAEPGSAALVVVRRHRDALDRLVSVGVHTHPADRYRIIASAPIAR